jgi:hypothetical protein
MTDAVSSPTPEPAREDAPPETERGDAPVARAWFTPPTPGLGKALAQAKARATLSRAELAKFALYVTIPVLCWVFYTTSSGMIDIMRREAGDWIGVVGTVIGTTAIITMLAATSWSLGTDLGALIARRQFLGERIVVKTLITGCVYLFVFSISAFFSFTYYYNNIFGLSSRKIAAELQPMELAAEVLLPAGRQIGENYDKESARIATAAGVRAYLDRLDALIQTGGAAGPALRDSLRRAQEEAQRTALLAAKKTANDRAEAQALHRQIEESQAKIASLEQTAAELEPVIKAKEEQMAQFQSVERQEDQLALDASKGLDNLGAACGPNCQSHRSKAETARKRVVALRETLAGPSAERANALKQRDLLAAELTTLKAQEESALSRRPPPSPKVETFPDISATLGDISEARNELRANPTSAKIREAKPACLLLRDAERQAGVLPAGVPADFDCETSGRDAHDLLTARDDVIAARAAFNQKCALDGALRQAMGAITAKIRASAEGARAGGAGFNEAKQLVDGCVVAGKAAGLSEAEAQALLRRSDQFLQAHSMERNRFELAREAFLKVTPDATMAIGVAIAQDAFMFIMKLLSEIMKRETKARERAPLPASMDVTDSDADEWDVRVLKTLLRCAKPFHGGVSSFDSAEVSIESLPADIRDNLMGLLNRLVRAGSAYADRKGVYMLDDRTLIEAESRLDAATKRKRVRNATSNALNPHDELLRFGEGEAGFGWRRGRGALQQYLSPRFSIAAQGEDAAE